MKNKKLQNICHCHSCFSIPWLLRYWLLVMVTDILKMGLGPHPWQPFWWLWLPFFRPFSCISVVISPFSPVHSPVSFFVTPPVRMATIRYHASFICHQKPLRATDLHKVKSLLWTDGHTDRWTVISLTRLIHLRHGCSITMERSWR